MAIPQQSLRVQALDAGCPIWLELNTEQQYQLWAEVARRMINLPLADTLLCLGAMVPIFESMGNEEQLKQIAEILGVR